ncbi:DUF2279 domain-containing protein [Bizionia sediminis]|uniref:DUF2279 domain-containing protein n=1 Tax=Bizionia sediminis TaxID=1737064 RepID=A0ABW5KWX6_9FLAO
MKPFCTFFIVLLCGLNGFSQSGINTFLKPSDTLHVPRRNAVALTEVVLGAGALVALNRLWYANYSQSKFHVYNDNAEWLQMDKLGHVFTAYQMGRLGASALNWSGVSKTNQLLYGGTLGFTFLTAVEVLDGFSEEWGFSWGDMVANAAGTGLFIGQELLWQEQRILLKYSFHRTSYAQQRPDVLGNGWTEEFLKDYNGQTYWLSFNLHAFLKITSLPKWLNIAFGYGADGMLNGSNVKNSHTILNQQQARQFYLSLDVDLTKIKTKSHVLKSVFEIFNAVKVPFPALAFHTKNGFSVHGIYF